MGLEKAIHWRGPSLCESKGIRIELLHQILYIKCLDFKILIHVLSKFTAIAEAGKKGDELTKVFFKEEYMLNYAIGELNCV